MASKTRTVLHNSHLPDTVVSPLYVANLGIRERFSPDKPSFCLVVSDSSTHQLLGGSVARGWTPQPYGQRSPTARLSRDAVTPPPPALTQGMSNSGLPVDRAGRLRFVPASLLAAGCLWTSHPLPYALALNAPSAGRRRCYAPLRITSLGARDWQGWTPSHRPTPFGLQLSGFPCSDAGAFMRSRAKHPKCKNIRLIGGECPPCLHHSWESVATHHSSIRRPDGLRACGWLLR